MVSSTVSGEYQGWVAIISLNKLQKLNSLTEDEFYHLASPLREVERRDEVFITLLLGTGTFFSAIRISKSRDVAPDTDLFRHGLREIVANSLNTSHALYTHSKIFVTTLNGPVVGLFAAVIVFSDFIYCVPHTYLLTPFSSLGLVAEDGALQALVQRMGVVKAKEALIMSRKIEALDLLGFSVLVLEEIEEWLGSHLNGDSMLKLRL
ncbi:ClpP/crotonase [Zopfia rhizophila CBS 207.26]|uniref:ClpP/crotonase n=1 Tax=Zopfia rhizophila CBS 207.26 TaxID=1314779 RepID=A0A6A6E799_9PEZI|nr:ClpP/crotonase [Zopfia rhizophila CBS 207.26]